MASFFRNFLESFCYLLYSLVFFLQYLNEHENNKRVLAIYYFVISIVIYYACRVALDYSDNNNWIYYIYYFSFAILMSYYFNQVLVGESVKKVNRYLLIIVLGVLLFTDITSYPFFNSIGDGIFFLFIAVNSLIYFKQLLVKVDQKNILLNFDFWLISGYLVYFLGSFFIILTYNYFTGRVTEAQKVMLADLWSIQNILLLISSIVSLFGFLWIRFQKKLH